MAHSARFAHSRQADLGIAAARQLIEERRLGQAFFLLQELLASEGDALVPDGEVWRSVTAEAARFAINLDSAAVADPLLATLERDADRAWEAIASQDLPHRALPVASRFPTTKRTRQIVWNQLLRDYDRGQFTLAADGFSAVAEDRRYETVSRRWAMALAIVASSRSGLTRQSDRLRKSLEASLVGAPARETESIRHFLNVRDNAAASQPPLVFPVAQRRVRPAPITASVDAVWQHHVTIPTEVATLLNDSIHEMQGQGIPFLPSHQPLVSGKFAITRLLDDLVAFDLETGEVRWRRATGSAWKQLSGNLKLLQNDGIAEMISRRLVYLLQGDSLYSRLSGDGDRVFGAIEPEDSKLTSLTSNPRGGPTRTPASTSTMFNFLAAWNVETGEEAWRVGGRPLDDETQGGNTSPHSSAVSSGAIDWANGVFFLGAPLVHDHRIYALGRRGAQQSLFVLHSADGELLWQCPLAEVSDEPATGDIRPLPSACQPVLHEGVLICPTSSGAVLGVDALRRSILWGWRYPRNDQRPHGGANQNQWFRQLLFPWWKNCRNVDVLVRDGKLALSGPDISGIHVLDVHSGHRCWSARREDALFPVTIAPSGVVVALRDRVLCLDSSTGETRWSAGTSPISGTGAADDVRLVMPLVDGGLVEISLNDGVILRRSLTGGEALGNLTAFPGGILSQSKDRLARLNSLEERLQVARAAARLSVAPADQLQFAKRLYEAGKLKDAALAAEKLRGASEEKEANRLARDAWLATSLSSTDPDETTWQKAESLLESPEERVQALELRGRAAASAGRVKEALEHWTRLLELNPTGDAAGAFAAGFSFLGEDRASDQTANRLRMSRHVQGQMLDLSLNSTSDDRAVFAEEMDRRFDRALRSPDPFAVQRFAEHFGGLPAGQRMRAREASRSGIGAPFVQTQLDLLELTQRSDRSLSAVSLRQYARLMDDRGWRATAAEAYRTLRNEFGDVPCDGDLTGRHVVDDIPVDSLLGRLIAQGAPEQWPHRPPTVTVMKSRVKDADFQPLPTTSDESSLLNRLTLSIDHEGRRVRFQGASQSSGWELALPGGQGMFRTAMPLHRAWGWGRLVVLRVGAELFGVVPLDERGDPNAKVVWRVDMMGGRNPKWNQLGVKLSPRAAGFELNEVVLVDRFGQEIGQVGPIQPGFICYRDQARLVCLHAATGKVLWERGNIPDGTTLAGNSEWIVMISPNRSRAELFRALDGKRMWDRPIGFPLEDVLAWYGARGLFRSSPDRLALHDFAENRRIGEWPCPATARPFAVDQRQFGIRSPSGDLEIIDIATGGVRNRISANSPRQVDAVYSACDESRCYVAVSGPYENLNLQRIHQERGGFRSPPVNGWLHAISRETGRLEWSVPLQDAAFPYDQPRETPFLVIQHHAFVAEGDPQNPVSVLRLLDRRDGAERHVSRESQHVADYVIEPNVENRRIDFRQPHQTVRFEFPE